jgi:DNA-binding response OmpR family regulator
MPRFRLGRGWPVFEADAKILRRIKAFMQRVLIVDSQPGATKILSELLRDICLCQIWTAPDAPRGLALAETIDPRVIFVGRADSLDGRDFTRTLRRSEFSCRKAPVIMISSESTAAAILSARDAGVHEFLRKPYMARDLLRRLEAVTSRPRDWVEGVDYVGPDRRRFNSGDYSGPLKRRVDHAETSTLVRILQAVKILKAAVLAIDVDRSQAMRSMAAQADELLAAARAISDAKLGAVAIRLRAGLSTLDPETLRRSDLEPLLVDLWAYAGLDRTDRKSDAA